MITKKTVFKEMGKITEENFFCHHCFIRFNSKNILNLHISLVHKENELIKSSNMIEIKKNNNISKEISKNNTSVSQKKQLSNDKIKQDHTSRMKLKGHTASVYMEEKQHKCFICDYSCASKPYLKRHISQVHEERKPLKCNKNA